jgi:hypothetical protein
VAVLEILIRNGWDFFMLADDGLKTNIEQISNQRLI